MYVCVNLNHNTHSVSQRKSLDERVNQNGQPMWNAVDCIKFLILMIQAIKHDVKCKQNSGLHRPRLPILIL